MMDKNASYFILFVNYCFRNLLLFEKLMKEIQVTPSIGEKRKLKVLYIKLACSRTRSICQEFFFITFTDTERITSDICGLHGCEIVILYCTMRVLEESFDVYS